MTASQINSPARPVVVAGDTSLVSALKTVLGATFQDVPVCSVTDTSAPSGAVGVTAAAQNTSRLRKHIIDLLNADCHAILILWDGTPKAWNDTGWQKVAGRGLERCHPNLCMLVETMKLIGGVIPAVATGGPHKRRLKRCLHRLQAENLYELIGPTFGHNAKDDITNAFLAPARVLLHASLIPEALASWREYGRDLLDKFKGTVCKHASNEKEAYLYGELGTAVCDAVDEVEREFGSPSGLCNRPAACESLSRLMELLAVCRQTAGEAVPAPQDTRTVGPTHIDRKLAEGKIDCDASRKRVLVIDDDARKWLDVLTALRNALCNEKSQQVDIYVGTSPYGIAARVENGVLSDVEQLDIPSAIPDFDLLLLDIYLGRDAKTGLAWLEDIRKRTLHLPVVLWTTSTDKELPAKAALANGYIFKKLATLRDMVTIISQWLDSGRGVRLWSLPNPFFDCAIRSPGLRELALGLTKWSLRYMDCFHATDDFHFRYYNDHGGRHIVGVLNVMEKLLRPFLLDQRCRVLPDDGAGCELEFLCLYAAILCHEFGMFPILDTDEPCDATPTALTPHVASLFKESGDKIEFASPEEFVDKVAEVNKKRQDAYEGVVKARRTVHALRGMMMLASNVVGGRWKSRVGRYKRHVAGLDAVLADLSGSGGNDCEMAVAVLVGYHQRLLPLRGGKQKRSQFLRVRYFSPEWEKPRGKLETANAALGASRCDLRELVWILHIARKRLCPDRTARLRAQCALMRFADALDVDRTRAPADFLLAERDQRRSVQDMEDCKRLVLMTCDIDMGQVSVAFQAPAFKTSMIDTWSELAIACTGVEAERATIRSHLESHRKRFSDAWHITNQQAPKGFVEHADMSAMKSHLERAVAGFFVKCRDLATPQVVKGEDVMDVAGRLDASKPAVAHAAALLVLYEILDEYTAIVDARLNATITLNPSLSTGGGDVAWTVGTEPIKPWPAFLDKAIASALTARGKKVASS